MSLNILKIAGPGSGFYQICYSKKNYLYASHVFDSFLGKGTYQLWG